jgi:hypothetical protein
MSMKPRKDAAGETKDLFVSLEPDPRHATQTKLLQALSAETAGHVRNKIGDAVAEIARQYTDDGRPHSYMGKTPFLLSDQILDLQARNNGPKSWEHCSMQASRRTPANERPLFESSRRHRGSLKASTRAPCSRLS